MERSTEHIVSIIFRLKKLWQEDSQLRLGQLIANLNEDIYFMEDEVLLEKLEAFYNGLPKNKK